ncbi:uncharacterized protein drn isoform X3 [Macrobrachium rosenbergii]|uniref:uncharacterized protein drn isoform X3 n=1 Tax=Macrobrachium rosenbergii TaxID=79674 RepID=UPI0034D52632
MPPKKTEGLNDLIDQSTFSSQSRDQQQFLCIVIISLWKQLHLRLRIFCVLFIKSGGGNDIEVIPVTPFTRESVDPPVLSFHFMLFPGIFYRLGAISGQVNSSQGCRFLERIQCDAIRFSTPGEAKGILRLLIIQRIN